MRYKSAPHDIFEPGEIEYEVTDGAIERVRINPPLLLSRPLWFLAFARVACTLDLLGNAHTPLELKI